MASNAGGRPATPADASVLLGDALIAVALDIVVVAPHVRAARRAWRSRQNGILTMADAALTGPVITLTCVNGVHRICTRAVVMRWVWRTVAPATGRAAGPEN